MCKFTNRLFVFTLLASTSSASEAATPSIMRHGSRFGLVAHTRHDNIVVKNDDERQNEFFDGSDTNAGQEEELNQPNSLDNDIEEVLGASAFLYLRKLFDQLWLFTLLVDRAADRHKLLASTQDNHYPAVDEPKPMMAPTNSLKVVKVSAPKKLAKNTILPKIKLTKSLAAGSSNARAKPKLAISSKMIKQQ